jgi:hypothetical protein
VRRVDLQSGVFDAAPIGNDLGVIAGEGIKPFSKTDFTEDLQKFDVPTVAHWGDRLTLSFDIGMGSLAP